MAHSPAVCSFSACRTHAVNLYCLQIPRFRVAAGDQPRAAPQRNGLSEGGNAEAVLVRRTSRLGIGSLMKFENRGLFPANLMIGFAQRRSPPRTAGF
jgi:hypothetical protein